MRRIGTDIRLGSTRRGAGAGRVVLMVAAMLSLCLAGISQGRELRLTAMNGSFGTIFFPDEAPVLMLRIHGGRMKGSLSFRYTITNVYGRVVSHGSEPPSSGAWGWTRLHLRLPKDRALGWFRVSIEALLSSRKSKNSKRVGHIVVDMAVIARPMSRDPGDAYFGISGGFGAGGSAPSITEVNAVVLRRLGVRWLRLFVNWSHMQPQRNGPIDWRRMDQIVDATRRVHIRVLPVVVFAPAWAQDPRLRHLPPNASERQKRGIPPKLALWQHFLEQAVKRYRGRITYWEVWNEPNARGAWLDGNAKRYAALLKGSYQTIKQANPKARVVMAGLSGVKLAFLRQLVEAGAGPWIEVANIHPYRYAFTIPETANPKANIGYGRRSLLDDLHRVRAMMAKWPPTASGVQRQLWITEAGYNTGPSNGRALFGTISEAAQARLLVRTMVLARAAGVNRFFWWRLFDTYGGRLGLVGNQDDQFEPKPAYAAYAVLERKLGGASRVKLLASGGQGVYLVRADRPQGPVWVAWAPRGKGRIAIEPDGSSTGRVTDIMGEASSVAPGSQGLVEMAVDRWPIYVEGVDNVSVALAPTGGRVP